MSGFWFYESFLKTAPSMHKQDAKYRLTAVKLYNEFDTDEEKANKSYLNQVVEVTGTVVNIQTSDILNPIIALETAGYGLVNVTLVNADELKEYKLNEGQIVTIKGECIGLLLDVLITNAIIVKC